MSPKRTHRWGNTHMKRCSMSLIREMQINHSEVHLSKWPSSINQTSAGEDVEKREPLGTVGGVVNRCNCWGKLEVPQKIKDTTYLMTHNSASGYLSKEMQNTSLKIYLHPCVHCSIIYSRCCKMWKQPGCPLMDRWVKKCMYTVEYYLAIKKNQILFVTT